MKRVAIVAEGDTEEEFVKQVLGPHLEARGVITAAMKPSGLGGNISVDRLAPVMAKLSWNFDAVTSLVDFYGFKGKLSGESATDLEARIDSSVRRHNPQRTDTVPQFAYVQQHEFEALLFSAPAAFNVIPSLPPNALDALEQVAHQFATPEDINDDRNTAPSKRIVLAVPNFRKRLHGPVIAKEISLAAIRDACPRFHAWASQLESLQS